MSETKEAIIVTQWEKLILIIAQETTSIEYITQKAVNLKDKLIYTVMSTSFHSICYNKVHITCLLKSSRLLFI